MAHVKAEHRLTSGILAMKHAWALSALLVLTLIGYRGQYRSFFIWFLEPVNHDFIEELLHESFGNCRVDCSHQLATGITAQRNTFLSLSLTVLRDNRSAAFGSRDPVRDDRELNCHSL
jgi:hypothetical protein